MYGTKLWYEVWIPAEAARVRPYAAFLLEITWIIDALRVGGEEVVASMRAWRLEPLPDIKTRRRWGLGEDVIVAL